MADLPVTRLTLATWNLAMLERSAEAPPRWSQVDTENEVRRAILRWAPDLVLFQELPGLVPFVETHGMIRSNPRSHSGNLATLITHELLMPEPPFASAPGTALITTIEPLALTIANVHLAPGRQGKESRLATIEEITNAAPTDRLLIAGDTNTRSDEIAPIRALGLAAPPLPGPTWDGRRNRFRAGGPRFTASFTRVFTRGDVTMSDVTVHTEPVVSDDGDRFHLSDHFALTGTVQIPERGSSAA